IRRASRPSCRRRGRRRRKPRTPGTPAGPFAAPVEAPTRSCTQWRRSRHPRSLLLLCTRHVFRLPLVEGCRNSGSANDRRARDLPREVHRRKARMAEGSSGLGHLVTPANWLARIAHDPQHICERQLAGCGCFLPHLLVGAAGRSLGSASARPLSPVCVHPAIAVDRKPRASRSVSGSLVPQYGTASTIQRGVVDLVDREVVLKKNLLVFCPPRPFSIATDRHDRDARPMSASPPILSVFIRRIP